MTWIYRFILHWFYLSNQIALTEYIFAKYCHLSRYNFVFWYLIQLERGWETVIVKSLFLFFVRQSYSRFGIFNIAGWTQYTFLVWKYQINLHLLRNRTEKIAKDPLFYLFQMLVQINLTFADNVCILFIYIYFCLRTMINVIDWEN